MPVGGACGELLTDRRRPVSPFQNYFKLNAAPKPASTPADEFRTPPRDDY
ncbi:MAG: hypothetical protein ACR2QC_07490 [Gammaproteobacteria bacterium]